jgi:hypothetical protein
MIGRSESAAVLLAGSMVIATTINEKMFIFFILKFAFVYNTLIKINNESFKKILLIP